MPDFVGEMLPVSALTRPDSLVSTDGRFGLYIEADGRLALYAYKTDTGRTLLWGKANANPLQNPHGAPNGYLAFTIDGAAGYVSLELVNPDAPISNGENMDLNKVVLFRMGPGVLGTWALKLHPTGELALYRTAPNGVVQKHFTTGTGVTSPNVRSTYVQPRVPIVTFPTAGVLVIEPGAEVGEIRGLSSLVKFCVQDATTYASANGVIAVRADALDAAQIDVVNVTLQESPVGGGSSGDAIPGGIQTQREGNVLTLSSGEPPGFENGSTDRRQR